MYSHRAPLKLHDLKDSVLELLEIFVFDTWIIRLFVSFYGSLCNLSYLLLSYNKFIYSRIIRFVIVPFSWIRIVLIVLSRISNSLKICSRLTIETPRGHH